jgi:hypothetical protein
MGIRVSPALAAPVLIAAFRAWETTLRTREYGLERVEAAKKDGHSLVFAGWHNELFTYLTARGDKSLATIVSRSRDGEYLARVLNNLGLATARGSSSRGGMRAMVEAVRIMRDGRDAIITVDGPKGPRHVVKDGVIYLACKTGALIVPVRGLCSFKKIFRRAWDRFELPLPGARCRVVYGEPYAVSGGKPDKAMLERETVRLREKMDALGEEVG